MCSRLREEKGLRLCLRYRPGVAGLIDRTTTKIGFANRPCRNESENRLQSGRTGPKIVAIVAEDTCT